MKRHSNLRLRACITLVLGILMASMLQGCLLTRVMETRTQLCDDKPSRVTVARQPGSGLHVVFERPTLTDRDIVWIVGHDPTEVVGTDQMRRFSYVALPLHQPSDGTNSLVAKLLFARLDGEYRLAKVEIPDKFSAILSAPFLDAVVRVGCQARIGFVPPTTTFDLASLDRSTLPTRDVMTRLLGPPAAAVAGTDEVSYRYCLAPCGTGAAMVAHATMKFGDHGELQRLDGGYFRYAIVADLIASKATATVELR